MPTRRDQLHAYRFEQRRAVAALVTGEPNAREAPLRRLTLATLSGIVIAAVVAAGFAVLGLLNPPGASARPRMEHSARLSTARVIRTPARCGLGYVRLDRRDQPHRLARRTAVPQYTLSQEALAAGATKVDLASTEIQGHLATLRSEVETMLGGWRGEAATSFVRVHETFEAQANQITGALHHMHEALLATHRTYTSQESTQTQTLTGLAGRING